MDFLEEKPLASDGGRKKQCCNQHDSTAFSNYVVKIETPLSKLSCQNGSPLSSVDIRIREKSKSYQYLTVQGYHNELNGNNLLYLFNAVQYN